MTSANLSIDSAYHGPVTVIFHGKLTDFFKVNSNSKQTTFYLREKTSIKHIIEALGVPHPEVGRILVNQKEVDFSFYPSPGDDIHIYPFENANNSSTHSPPKFILDNHLGKLTAYLRLLGIDAAYDSHWDDAVIARIASEQNRVVLTRDRGLLKRKIIQNGYCVRSATPLDQVREIIRQFNLQPYLKPFTRCPRCNGLLNKVEKQTILHLLQPLTRQYYNDFSRCSSCGQIYWKGSHYERLKPLIQHFTTINEEEEI
ncbi:MAG: Mut7-C RNAse domain-containing protein [Chloroflexota bacterium]